MVKKKSKKSKLMWKKIWWFIWEDDSIWSWVVNIVLAFVLIKFIVYPGLGFLLSTTFPIVAVVSSSMEHDQGFEEWWGTERAWYLNYNITKDNFINFDFNDGFDKGDIMILYGTDAEDIEVGDVIVFRSMRPDPIIHRVVRVWESNGQSYYQTKGDHNPDSIKSIKLDETRINEQQLLGRAVVRVPLLGYIKIWFVELINLFMR